MDSFVVIEYSLRLDDGSFVKGEHSPASLNFVVGYGQVLQALEKGLTGLEQGDQIDILIPARDGFGERDQNLVQTLPRSGLPRAGDLEPGRWAIAKNQATGAQYGYFICKKTDETVTVDYNHPLAGKNLHYKIEVVLVRPALTEELEFLRPCEHGSRASQDGADL